LEAPVKRVCGYDTPFPLVFEALYLPDNRKIFEAIKETVGY
jgi:2-oxoisovalerate dehydrogenase E1 component beta subunit